MSGEGITPVHDWHRIAQLQKQVRDLELSVARLDQLLSGKQQPLPDDWKPVPVVYPAPKRTLLQRIFRKP